MAHVHDVVRHEVQPRKKLRSSSRPAPAWTPDGTASERATAKEKRAVARTFSLTTTAAPDNVHPRHFLLLDDGALE
eukprot:6982542-Pyramimonas_sp.AAC.1